MFRKYSGLRRCVNQIMTHNRKTVDAKMIQKQASTKKLKNSY
jgi:hypothetical protein